MKVPNWLKSWEVMLAVALIGEILVLGLINPTFLNIENLLFSTSDFAHVMIAALGLTLVIITGGIDISGVSIMGLASIVLGLAFVAGAPIWLAVGLALATGIAGGTFNGTIVANTDVNPLVITLATLFLFAGIATGLPTLLDMLGFKAYGAGGFEAYQYEGITGLPKSFTWIGTGGIGWVPTPLIIVVVLAAVAGFILHRTRFGRYLYLIGVSADVARFSGVPVKRTLVTVYAFNGFTRRRRRHRAHRLFHLGAFRPRRRGPAQHHHRRRPRRHVDPGWLGLGARHVPGRSGARLPAPGPPGARRHLGRGAGHRRRAADRLDRAEDRHDGTEYETRQPRGLRGRATGSGRKKRMTARHSRDRGRQTVRDPKTFTKWRNDR